MSAAAPAADLDQQLQVLLDRCAAADARALERLYELASPFLFACLTRMLRRRALAEEALQDVFISIWQRAGQYQSGRGSALGWLTGIARYRAIDLLRHERGAPILVPEPPEPSGGATAEEPPAPGESMTDCLGQLTGE